MNESKHPSSSIMKLFFRKSGAGSPVFILHGLFGSSDNWHTLGKRFESDFTVYYIDQRNHGRSPHSPVFNYDVMSDDILKLVEDENLIKINFIGHSMGGKAAMQFAIRNPHRVGKMLIADIGPKKYPVTNRFVTDVLNQFDLYALTSRKEVEKILFANIKDNATVQFLLKNLYWNEKGKLSWRFDLESITNNIERVSDAQPLPHAPIPIPVLFLKGEKSDYIFPSDIKLMRAIFPFAIINEILNAGHWIHADQPEVFYKTVLHFLTNTS